MTNKGFRSILSDRKYNQSSYAAYVAVEDYQISDCSNESEQENNQHNLTIEWSDDDTGQQFSTSFQSKTKCLNTSTTRRRKRCAKPLENVKFKRKTTNQQAEIQTSILNTKSIHTIHPKASLKKLNKIRIPLSTNKNNNNYGHKESTKQKTMHYYDDDSENMTIECSYSDEESLLSITQNSQIIETPTTASSQELSAPDELDLLLALIEKESNDKASTKERQKKKPTRCKKGGYLQQLQKVLENAKADCKFLEHDKKLGLQCGTVFYVANIIESCGAYLARLENISINTNLKLFVVLSEDQIVNIKEGSKVEAFFDETPYKVKDDCNGQDVSVYVQPNKLLPL